MVATEAIKNMEKMQCKKRNEGPACRMPNGKTSPACGFKCTGDVMKQPAVCGFHAAWGFLEKTDSGAMEDYCQDVNAYRQAVGAHLANKHMGGGKRFSPSGRDFGALRRGGAAKGGVAKQRYG